MVPNYQPVVCYLMLFPIKMALHRLFLSLECPLSILLLSGNLVLLDPAPWLGLLLESRFLLHCRVSCCLACSPTARCTCLHYGVDHFVLRVAVACLSSPEDYELGGRDLVYSPLNPRDFAQALPNIIIAVIIILANTGQVLTCWAIF